MYTIKVRFLKASLFDVKCSCVQILKFYEEIIGIKLKSYIFPLLPNLLGPILMILSGLRCIMGISNWQRFFHNRKTCLNFFGKFPKIYQKLALLDAFVKAKLIFCIDFIQLDQACQTQNTVRAAHWVLMAKNLSLGRSLKIYNTFFV